MQLETKESWNDFHWESVSEEIEEAIKVASEKERLRKAKNESRFFSSVDFASGFMAGVQWKKDQFEQKAFDWLYERYNKQGYLDIDDVDDFKKAMEEQL